MKPLRRISMPVGVAVGCAGVGVTITGVGVGVAVGPGVGSGNEVGRTTGVGEGVAAVGTGTNGVIVGVATLAVAVGSTVFESPVHAASANSASADIEIDVNFLTNSLPSIRYTNAGLIPKIVAFSVRER